MTPSLARGIVLGMEKLDLSRWAEKHYYIADGEKPIGLMPHQKSVLRYCFTRDHAGRFPFDTVIYSTPKKGGKSTISGVIGRWACETWGRFGEVLYVGNDADQARERGFASHKQSIELTPGFHRSKSALPNRWRVMMDYMQCIHSGTVARAIATDYQGEAGANPILTIWEELWGFIHKDALRFWAEVAPSPTHPNSVRLVVTYAGYEGESELLWRLYEQVVLNGRQLTRAEVGPGFDEAIGPTDFVPCWEDRSKGIFAYWDSGELGRRMPWQKGEKGARYYSSEEATQTPQQFRRLHFNEWVSAESEFLPIQWWDACQKPPLPLVPGETTPLVMSLDAAVTGDCFGLVVVSRDPQNPKDVAVRVAQKWDPPRSGAIKYDGPRDMVKAICRDFNVVEVCYDPYQLVDFVQGLSAEGVAYFHQFNQGKGRLESDKQLYDLIAHRRVRHNGEPDLREHIQNCAAKHGKDEDTKLRLIKKAETRKIDLAVCLSMACFECLRLNLA